MLLWSNSFKNLRTQLSFFFSKHLKLFVLFFKWQKEIQLLQLSYFKEWRFEKSYLIIHFNLKNAVWYQLKNIKIINSKTPIVLNLENIKEDKIEFIVYGLFRKKTFIIDVSKSEKLITENFKASIRQINNIKSIRSSFSMKIKSLALNNQSINLKVHPIKTSLKPINLKLKQYNQNEFL